MRAFAIVGLLLSFPVLEAWLLFELGDRYGVWVVVWLIGAAIAGLALIRLEKVLWAIRLAATLRESRSPMRALLVSARTVVIGVLLIFPGVITDAAAIMLWLWPLPDPQAFGRASGSGVIEGEFRREGRTERLPPRD